jgi:hypothetical protein
MDIKLNPEEVALLQHLAALQNITVKQALKKALVNDLFIKRQVIKDSKFYVMTKEGFKRVTWK